MTDQPLVDDDPVLFDSASYQQARQRSRAIRGARWAELLECARSLRDHPLLARMAELLADHAAADLLSGRTFTTWMGALERALGRFPSPEGAAALEAYCDTAAFERDIAAEYPHLGFTRVAVPFEIIHDGVTVVPLQALARSPRFGPRLRKQFAGIADAAFDRRAFGRGVRHLEESLGRLRAVSALAHQGFQESIHSIALILVPTDVETSTSSRPDEPGSAVAGISETAVQNRDLLFTASVLYHEHAHNKLALYTLVTAAGLESEPHFVSPFVNANRPAELICHQIYSIGMEAAVRASVLPPAGPELSRVVQHLAATRYPLEIATELLPLMEADRTWRQLVDRIEGLSRRVLGRVDALVAEADPELRRQCEAERERMAGRHAWNVGQCLVRGVAVRDPGLEWWRREGDVVRYGYRGAEHSAAPGAGAARWNQGQSRFRSLSEGAPSP